MNVNAKPSSTFKLEAVHPDPSQAHKMPYAPAIKIVGACDLMFLSGATASPLYHNHPHQDHEHVHPHSIEQQTKNAMDAIKSILDSQGATWRDVIKVTKYLTDFREADAMHKTMAAYFGDWLPASTTVCINQLSSPGRADRARHDRGAAEVGGEVAGALAIVLCPHKGSGRIGGLNLSLSASSPKTDFLWPSVAAFNRWHLRVFGQTSGPGGRL